MHPRSLFAALSRRIGQTGYVVRNSFSRGVESSPAWLRLGGVFFSAPQLRKSSDECVGDVFCGSRGVCHAKNFCRSKPLNTTQLIGAVL